MPVAQWRLKLSQASPSRRMRCGRIYADHRRKHAELEIAEAPAILDGGVVPQHLRGHPGERFALGGVEPSRRMMRRARFIFGMRDSPKPQRRPLASQRISSALLLKAYGQGFEWCTSKHGGIAGGEHASNLFWVASKGKPDNSANAAAAGRNRVAVEACAHGRAAGRAAGEALQGGFEALQAVIQLAHVAAEFLPSVSGVASCRWVRPILTMWSNAADFCCKVSRSACTSAVENI